MRHGGGDQTGGPGNDQGGERRRWRDQQANSSGQEQGGMRRGGGDQTGAQGSEQGRDRRRLRDQQAGGPGAGPASEGGQRFSGFSMSTAAIEGQWRLVWVLGPDKKPQKRFIQLGITDGSSTEILQGDLKEGDVVIVGQNITSENRPQNRQNPPGFGGPGGGPGRGGFGGGPGGGRR